ncbi:hypothetical protein BDN72DRAFT_846303 [Pluteus cervinus]|uniref:Uncharacterized protein n=1 Tax=Pluteus cervinus TaxID=181527 RepID=A0ACD3AH65_9AGAR|nr:hypothetical protein BDN72DRAFT_846303 [Pluteus cervinus]
MLIKCANALSREQELSGPEVVSLLMGWGDTFTSHQYVPIYLNGLRAYLKGVFPKLGERV